jgi:predicted amidohydrolase
MQAVAAIQMASGSNVTANLNEAARLINEAANMGAKLIVLPENFALMANTPHDYFEICETQGSGLIQDFLSQQAAQLGIWLVGGTIPIKTPDADKYRAACLLFDNTGDCVTRYDKMHLFDVLVTDNERYCESKTIDAGNEVIVVDTPCGRLGMAVCYDLRFPELFRKMQTQEVEIISVVSAFTAITGKAHWEVLVRSRAIENLSYVIAPNQGGYHVNGRETYGHSMIVDPWGVILSDLNQGSGVISAEIDLKKQSDLRHSFPVLKHRKILCS